jgi:hypothetical protein
MVCILIGDVEHHPHTMTPLSPALLQNLPYTTFSLGFAERWLPSPKLRHPYPDWRFDVMTRGGSPVR